MKFGIIALSLLLFLSCQRPDAHAKKKSPGNTALTSATLLDSTFQTIRSLNSSEREALLAAIEKGEPCTLPEDVQWEYKLDLQGKAYAGRWVYDTRGYLGRLINYRFDPILKVVPETFGRSVLGIEPETFLFKGTYELLDKEDQYKPFLSMEIALSFEILSKEGTIIFFEGGREVIDTIRNGSFSDTKLSFQYNGGAYTLDRRGDMVRGIVDNARFTLKRIDDE